MSALIDTVCWSLLRCVETVTSSLTTPQLYNIYLETPEHWTLVTTVKQNIYNLPATKQEYSDSHRRNYRKLKM